jgi:hypothetical protein
VVIPHRNLLITAYLEEAVVENKAEAFLVKGICDS